MNKLYPLLAGLALILTLVTGCGYTARDSEMMGQVKKVRHETPLICPDFLTADISLGVMRNGVGSMSSQDIWVTVEDTRQYDVLKAAAESGQLVKITYDQRRVALCTHDDVVRSIELVK